MKVEIIPAILPKDFSEVQEKIALVQDYVKTVQIDICDGQFVNNATWPYRKDDVTFDKIIHEEEGLPGWDKLNFEIDLMVNKPDQVVEQWVIAGASRIITHAEAKGDVKGAIAKLIGRVEVVVALSMETPIDRIRDLGLEYEQIGSGSTSEDNQSWSIQLMGIDHIGFQGEPFDIKVIDRVKEVRVKYPNVAISIDGGVSLDNAKQLVSAGANRLVVGSGIFNADNYLEALQKFKHIVNTP